MTSPRRWLEQPDGLPPELRRALEGAPEPSSAELQRLGASLGASLGIALASSTALSQIPKVAALGLGTWFFGGTAAGVAVSLLIASLSGSFPAANPPIASAAPVASVVRSGVSDNRADEVSHASSAAPVPVPRATASGAEPAPASSLVAVDEADEVSLLRAAQAELNAQPSRALALVALHQRKFARGLLAQEREVIAIEALLALGRTEEARARAAAFERSHPGSAHSRRLERALSSPPP